jgi:thioredoxin 1
METFSGEIELASLTSKAPLSIVYVSSQWCGPCKQFTPLLEEFEKGIDHSKVSLVKLDVTDGAPKFIMNLGIKMVPVLLFYKDGKLVAQEKGLKSKQSILGIIEGLL